ncbi:MAG: oligopeptide transport system ATP-binding protein oppD [Mycobacterium sp.]|nr:yliA [Mycobacterium sp.]MDT5134987.1 oligopeptide transport system ATP-binding protein oppD [Mycobacterium sp.]
MTHPLLSVEDLEVRFGNHPSAVSGATLTVYPGQTVALVGESGSGKSTTAAAVLGLLPPGGRITAGRIVFDGSDITHADRRRFEKIRGRRIGLVPQDPMTNLNPVWRVGFQVREALRANGIATGRAARRQAVELLDDAGMSDSAHAAHRYPHQLSGGMCQRALIAVGLAGRPQLLIADEPTSALDVTIQRQVLDHLDTLAAELGTAVLLITHDLALAAERAGHLVVMYRGAVVESGPATEVIADPRHGYTRRLVASAPSLVMRGEPKLRTGHPAGPVTPVLEVSGLTKVYRVPGGPPWRRRDITAVDSVSFRVRRGSTTAIVGESGSGKSTLARMILGLLRATSGTVTFDGSDIAALDRREAFAFRRRVQPVFQNPYSSLDPMFSVYRTIEEPLRTHGIGNRVQRQRAVRELLDQVALPSALLRRFPRELSGGQRQRVAIARALALQPEMLVCDEAVSALDVLVQAQILALLSELQIRLGLTYLFIGHDLAVVRQIADDVVVMQDGRVVEHAPAEALFTNPRRDYTRRLLDAIPGASPRRGRG